MKNYEKYAEKIREYDGDRFCVDFVQRYILEPNNVKCMDILCSKCHMLQTLWLLEEYEEPETDWSKVKVDTPILVRDYEYEKWLKRYFAKYENGFVYAWNGGATSWNEDYMTGWKYAKLAESEEE